MFWRGPGNEPRFIFGSEDGIALYDALTGEMVRRLSRTPCWELRWSDDRSILMANLPCIPAQTSQLVFYEVAGPESLIMSRTYSFDKRMDGWDLACGNRLLAATLTVYTGASPRQYYFVVERFTADAAGNAQRNS